MLEFYCTVYEGIECVVTTHTYVLTGAVNSTALTLDDIACLSKLTTENLNTESLAF